MKKILLPLALLGCLTLQATPEGWITSYPAALKTAAEKNKTVLLDFTGSDWCGWCIKMHKETLSKKDFVSYAADNLVLVEVDFPNNVPQTAEQKKANEALKAKYGIEGFPTFILVDSNGKELGRQVGYLAGGPSAFTDKINSWKRAAK